MDIRKFIKFTVMRIEKKIYLIIMKLMSQKNPKHILKQD